MLETFQKWIIGLWTDFTNWARDFVIWILDGVLGGIATLIELVPAPDFLVGGAGAYVDGPSHIVYFLAMSQFDVGMGLIGAAVAFRLARIFVTVGIWS